uniref:Uncharacterized protein n=1 Tax=Oryza barthii TaxID=65489 RepID=A0A0D3FDZ2_9ORYZ
MKAAKDSEEQNKVPKDSKILKSARKTQKNKDSDELEQKSNKSVAFEPEKELKCDCYPTSAYQSTYPKHNSWSLFAAS